jgi:hypothetical protein
MRSGVVPTELHEFLFDKSLHKTNDNLITTEMERKQEMKIKYDTMNMMRKKKNKRKKCKSKQKGNVYFT